jgi:hypothetical protein
MSITMMISELPIYFDSLKNFFKDMLTIILFLISEAGSSFLIYKKIINDRAKETFSIAIVKLF